MSRGQCGFWRACVPELRIVNEYGPTEDRSGSAVSMSWYQSRKPSPEMSRSVGRSGTRGCMCWTGV